MGRVAKLLTVSLLGAGVSMMWMPPQAQAQNSIVTVDSAGDVGSYDSLVLDAAGNPVISYYDFDNADLKVAHCDDTDCAGGGERFAPADSGGIVGGSTSLLLDAAGNPVISYYDFSNRDLKLAHCDDVDCAGGGDSVATVDSSDGFVGEYNSLVLDAAGNPVISYYDFTNRDLKLAHCDDANCTGGGDSVVTVDGEGSVGEYNSLVLDAAGNPVISYYDESHGDLKVAHCDDANCAGGGESIVAADTVGAVGQFPSLVLDAAGNPVIAYHAGGRADLKVAHCDDANCAGGGESVVTLDSGGVVGRFTSLVLDAAGNPVISYLDSTNQDLKVAHCDDANCAGVGDRLVTVDSAGDVGWYTSLELDAAGNPVVSYRDIANQDLKLAHCDQASCVVDVTPPVVSIALDPVTADGTNGWYTSPVHVAVTATDISPATVRCALDPTEVPQSLADLPDTPCEPITVAADGDHVVYAAAVDAVGNTGPIVMQGFRLDRTAPETSVNLDPAAPDGADGWYVTPVNISVTATDISPATVRCALDPTEVPQAFADLPDTLCERITVEADGDHVVYAAAADAAGNSGPIVTQGVRVDRTAPQTSISFDPPIPDGADGWYVSPVRVSVTATDANPVTVRCALDPTVAPHSFADLPATPCDPFTVTSAGSHVVYGAAADHVGNGGPVVSAAFKTIGGLRCRGRVPTELGTPGHDVLIGTPGDDVIVGMAGADTIRGLGGDDVICAGDGNDTLDGGRGNDLLDGGNGADAATYATAPSGVNASLAANNASRGSGSDRFVALEHLTGSPFNDTLTGNAGANTIRGGGGNDRLHGAAGNDRLFGEAGNDVLNGGNNFDRGDGGAGTDTQTQCEVLTRIP
jgi:hypothetical protein